MSRVAVVLASVPGGWSVTSPLSAAPLMFLSGAAAEAQARRLATLAAGLGADAEIRTCHRNGDVSVREHVARGLVTSMPRRAPTPARAMKGSACTS